MSKQLILNNIREALKNKEKSVEEEHFKDIIKREEKTLKEEYIRLQKANMAEVIESTKETLLQDIADILLKANAKKMLYAMDLPCDVSGIAGVECIAYDKVVEESRNEMFLIDTSIVQTRCAVANLGIMGLSSSVHSPRLVSLISSHCIMLVDSKNIVANLFEGITLLKNLDKTLATNLLFVAGPSRTADIELKTVFGVHGPQKVSVIVY